MLSTTIHENLQKTATDAGMNLILYEDGNEADRIEKLNMADEYAGEEVLFQARPLAKQFDDLDGKSVIELTNERERAIIYDSLSKLKSKQLKPVIAHNGDYIIDCDTSLIYTDGNFVSPSVSTIIHITHPDATTRSIAASIVMYFEQLEVRDGYKMAEFINDDMYGDAVTTRYVFRVRRTDAWKNRGRKGTDRERLASFLNERIRLDRDEIKRRIRDEFAAEGEFLQERPDDPSAVSDRHLLANAYDQLASNKEELNFIKRYRKSKERMVAFHGSTKLMRFRKTNDKENNMIETDRLLLRPFTHNDFDALFEIVSDAETMQHYPKPFDEERTRGWIQWNLDNYRQYGFGLWAVVLKDRDRFIGDCGLTMQMIDGEVLPEIGYHIHKDYQRQGLGSEAARAVRDWAFTHTDFDCLYSYMKYTNIGSWKTAEANGMKRVKEYADPKNRISYAYAITREEWKKLQD